MNKSHTIPKHWKQAKLGELLKLRNGYAFKSSDYLENGIPVLRISDIQQGKVTSANAVRIPESKIEPDYIVKSGDILIAMSGATTGKFGIYSDEIIALQNQRVGNFITDEDKIIRPFLFFLLSALQRKIEEDAYGGAQPNISSKKIEDLDVQIPPLPEQRAIVAKIEAVFAELEEGVRELKAAKAQLKTYRQSVLKAAFEGKLTEEWRKHHATYQSKKENAIFDSAKAAEPEIAYKSNTLVKEGSQVRVPAGSQSKNSPSSRGLGVQVSSGPPTGLPEGWETQNLGKLIHSIKSGKSFRCEERPPRMEEVGIVKVSAVTWGLFQEKESKTCTDPTKINPEYFIKSGDFLLSRANTIELVGTCVIVKEIQSQLMLSDKILRIEFDGVIKPFAMYYLRSKAGRLEIESLSTGNQDSMRNIGQDRIRQIKIPLPVLEEQTQIVHEIETRLSAADDMEKAIDAALAQSEVLRQSVLKKAFEGRLVEYELVS